ncbi:FAD-dependent monooxygenase [Kutzneria buriramensis]|nr:FAD-dependent monooxygenase [Kutzneria buriramensis]
MAHALIIGAGIAGTTTAMALHKAGMTSTVYEAYPQGGDDVGAFLLVLNNGMDALRAIDAHHAVNNASFRTTHAQHMGPDDTVFTGGPMGTPDPDGPRTLTRAALYRALQNELLRRGGQIEHGKTFVSAHETETGGMVATFADGTQAEGDLLIGADGIWSATRRIIAPNASPTHTGSNLVYGYSRDPNIPRVDNTFRLITGSRGRLVYVTSPSGETYWGATIPGNPLDKADTQDQQRWIAELIDRFSVDPGKVPLSVVSARQDRVLVLSIYHLASPLPAWHSGSMVLVGDAAHAVGPSAGQGASVALEDGVILAKCLRDIGNLGDAFYTYHQLRADRLQQLLVLTQTRVSNLHEAKAYSNPNRRTFLYEHKIEWDEPITAVAKPR